MCRPAEAWVDANLPPLSCTGNRARQTDRYLAQCLSSSWTNSDARGTETNQRNLIIRVLSASNSLRNRDVDISKLDLVW